MKNKYAIFPIVMGTLALLCFLAVAFFMAFSVQPLWGRLMVLLFPAIILYAVACLSAKGKINSRKTVILTLVLTIVLLLVSIFYILLLAVWTATTVTTDVRYYSKAYAQIDDEDGVEGIFPASIPTDAKDVVFHYNPQFLQGGEVFELSYIVPDDMLSEWTNRLEKKAEWIGPDEEWHRLNNWRSHNERNAIRYHLHWDGGFNHGEMSYVLVESSTNRITFYYTDW